MKKFIITLMTVSIFGLAACATTPEIKPVSRNQLPPSTASEEALKKGEETIRGEMKDPASVQFRNVAAYTQKDSGPPMICGELNGKNSYGGYGGFKHFIFIGGTLMLDNSGDETAEWVRDRVQWLFNDSWNKNCK